MKIKKKIHLPLKLKILIPVSFTWHDRKVDKTIKGFLKLRAVENVLFNPVIQIILKKFLSMIQNLMGNTDRCIEDRNKS